MATLSGSLTFILLATSPIALMKQADQPAANNCSGLVPVPGTPGAENLTSKATIITAEDTAAPTARSMGLGGVPHLHAVLRGTSYCDGFLIICHPIFLRLPVKNRQGEVNESVIR